jgi:curli biogenesis system outer membrane secretion channel CsgG
MPIGNFKKSNFITIFILLSVALIANAQPPKDRGVAGKPKTATPTTSTQTTPTPTPSKNTPKDTKKTIVVLDFQDNTLGAESEKRNWGKQIAVLLATKFSQSGNFYVIEQQEKEQAIVQMQNDSFKDSKNKSYQARIGKLVSANIVVFGDILEYTTKKEGTSVLGVGQAKFSAKVRLAVRLVDVNTGISVDATTVEGKSNVKATAGGVFGKGTEIDNDLKTALFTDAVNAATQNAVSELIKLIEQPINPTTTNTAQTTGSGNNLSDSNSSAAKTEEPKKGGGGLSKLNPFKKKNKETEKLQSATGDTKPIEAQPSSPSSPDNSATNSPYIAAIDGQNIYVVSLPAGTKVGTKLIAYKLGKSIVNKRTGEIISQEEITIAELEIISIKDKSFICKVLSGSGLTEDSLIKIAK